MFLKRMPKISTDQAAKLYLESLHQVIEQTWTIDLETINEFYPDYSLLPNAPYAKADLLLCVVSLELQTVSNKLPQKRIQIERSIINELTTNYSNGEQAVNTIVEDYLPEIEYAVRKNLSPFDAAVHVFCGRLNLDVDVNVDLLKKMALTQLIITKTGIWKKIIDSYRIK